MAAELLGGVAGCDAHLSDALAERLRGVVQHLPSGLLVARAVALATPAGR